MKKGSPLSLKLASLSELVSLPFTDATRTAIFSSLTHSNNLVVAAGARLAKKHALIDATSRMVTAFDRFCVKGAQSDKICFAKNAIVDALDEIGYNEVDVYVKAAAYHQPEPSFGGSRDTAAKLRIRAAQALLRIGWREIFYVFADLLCDAEAEVRFAAGKLLGELDEERSELLLRMKIASGDAKPENYGAYFSSLCAINAQRSLPFIIKFLSHDDEIVVDEAIIALGETRLPEAYALLTERYRYAASFERQRLLLIAISLIRSDDAGKFLVNAVAQQSSRIGCVALEALGLYADHEQLMKELADVVKLRDDAEISEKHRELFACA